MISTGVTTAFKNKLRTNIAKLSTQQNTDIEVLVSKQQHYATIIYKVQLIIDKARDVIG